MTIKHLYPVVEPSLNLDFANSKKLDPRITFTRGSIGTYVGEDGLIKTAAQDEARFDHDPTTGESLGLLVEESRTNAVNRSESDFGVASAIKTDDVVVAPDGNTTADQFESTGGGAFKAGIPVTNGTQVTYSVFLKKISGSGIMTSVGFNAFGSTNINGKVRVDLNDGTIFNLGALVEDSSITAYSNGWYRVSVTATATDTTAVVINYCDIGQVGAHTFSAWGMQVEEGSFPTSYIPTTTSAVTRAADVASISGSNFSSWYRQDEGTFYVKAVASVSSAIVTADGGSLVSRKPQISVGSFSEVTSSYVESGAVLASLNTGTTSAVFSHTTAYANNDYAAARDGGNLVVGTSGALPGSVTTLRLGRLSNGAASMNGHIRRLTYYPQRLPDATLQALTL